MNRSPGTFRPTLLSIRRIICSISLICCSFCCQSLYAQQWHSGSAQIPITGDKTPNAARREAFERALEQAVQQAGVEVSGGAGRMERESGGSYYDAFVRFTNIRAKGLVTDVDTLVDRQDMTTVAGGSPISVYRVELRAFIEPALGEPDPAFKLEMTLDRETYRDGETMTVTLQPTLDCYVTLFNLYSNDSLSILLPNEEMKDNLASANVPMMIPPPDAHWELPVNLALGREQDHEAILAVATREQVPFPQLETVLQRGLLARGDALLAINRWLAEVQLEERTEAWGFYRVVK